VFYKDISERKEVGYVDPSHPKKRKKKEKKNSSIVGMVIRSKNKYSSDAIKYLPSAREIFWGEKRNPTKFVNLVTRSNTHVTYFINNVYS